MKPFAARSIALLMGLVCCAPAVSAPPDVCRRVLPQAGFSRLKFANRNFVRGFARIGRDGERGLALVNLNLPEPPGTRFHGLQQILADTGDGVVWGPQLRLVSPDPTWSYPAELVAADFDGDEVDDLALLWIDSLRGSLFLDLYLGTAAHEYIAASRLDLGEGRVMTRLVAGDFDGDGLNEVVFRTEGDFGTALTRVALHDDVWQQLPSIYPPALADSGLAVFDHDNDGIDDLLMIDGYFVAWVYGSAAAPFERVDYLSLPFQPLQVVMRDDRLVLLEGWYQPLGGYWPQFRMHATALHEFDHNLQPLWRQDLPEGRSFLYPPLDLDGDGSQELIQGFNFGPVWFFWVNAPVSGEVWSVDEGDSPRLIARLGTENSLIASIARGADRARQLVTSDFSTVTLRLGEIPHDGAKGSDYFDGEGWDEPYAYTAAGDFDEDGLDDIFAQTFWADHAAIGRALGDGGFQFSATPVEPYEMFFPVIDDFDRDGHLDLGPSYYGTQIAWGRGDGSFDWPTDVSLQGIRTLYADITGDGSPEVLELTNRYGEPETVSSYKFVGRQLQSLGGSLSLSAELSSFQMLPADLDGDGRKDLVFLGNHYTPVRRIDLRWARSRGDGTFDPIAEFPHDPFPDGLGYGFMTSADVDLDGTDDLVLQLNAGSSSRSEVVTMRSTGSRLSLIARFQQKPPTFGAAHVVDLDGDGIVDLLDGYADPDFWPSYDSTVAWGNGRGEFVTRGRSELGISPGAVGRFRRDAGNDVARIRLTTGQLATIELFLGTGRAKASDEEPPTARFALLPVLDTTAQPARFEGQWQVVTTPSDDCDDRPVPIDRFVELLELPDTAAVSFRAARAREIRVYESPANGSREVLLLGPDETAMRALLAAARERGGFPFQHWGAALSLASTPAFGPERGVVDTKSRIVQRFVFDTQAALSSAVQTHPARDLSLAMRLRDRSGRIGVGRGEFQTLKREALARACAQNPSPTWACP
jgi:hypothetical protein